MTPFRENLISIRRPSSYPSSEDLKDAAIEDGDSDSEDIDDPIPDLLGIMDDPEIED